MNKIQSYFGEYATPDFLYNFYRESGQVLFMNMFYTKDTCRSKWSSSTLAATKDVVYYGDEGFPELEIRSELKERMFEVNKLGDTICTSADNEFGCLFTITYKANTAILPMTAYLTLRQSLQTRIEEVLRNHKVSPLGVSNDVSLESFCRYVFNASSILTNRIGVDAKFTFTIENGAIVVHESKDSEMQFSYMASGLFDEIRENGGTNALCAFLDRCGNFDAATFRTIQGFAAQRRIWIDYCDKYLLSVAKILAEFWVNALNGR